MRNTPDEVFGTMERRRAPVRYMAEITLPPRQLPAQTVYVPQNVRSGSYRQLMKSHDRMGTRHLV